MQVRDIQSLLEEFFSEGFTMNCLSKATNVPIEVIQKCYNNEQLSQEDFLFVNRILYFLMQLYMCDTSELSYLSDIVMVMHDYFGVPLDAICNYLELNKEQFETYINNPSQHQNSYNLTIKLLHLYTTLVREKSL